MEFQPGDSQGLPLLIEPHSSAGDSLHMVLALESSIQELTTDTSFVFQRYVSGYYPYDGVSFPTFFVILILVCLIKISDTYYCYKLYKTLTL